MGDETYLVIEFAEQFSIDEKVGSRGKLFSNCIEENLRTVVFVFL